MLAMVEWTRYANGDAKGLRVTKPVKGNAQRSTYFLSIPLRWAIPNIILFTLVHWLFSQMVFLARIEVFDQNGELDANHSTTTIFFSPLAMPLAVGVASAGIIIFIILAIFKRYPSKAPLAGYRSASISAACQPDPGEDEFEQGIELGKLKWGVTKIPLGDQGVGHATFSNGTVGRLLRGKMYA